MQPLNLLWALASCKRICARMRVCACLSTLRCVCVRARVYVRENGAGCDLYCSRNHSEGGGEPEQTKQRQEEGGKVPGAALIGSAPHHTRTHTLRHTHTHTYNLCIHLPLPSPPPHLLHICWSVTGRMGRRGRDCVASKPSPLLSNDGPLPAQQIGLIAQKNLPTCVEGKKKKKRARA